MAKKVLILGLDSATWDVLDPLMERGCMPNLQKLREQGCSGILDSTEPPLTPPAWTTLMTGVNPGKHKIVAFEEYDFDHNRLRFTNSSCIAVETMWSYLSRLGYRVASLNMPWTYPPFAVNGVMVAGYGCPGIQFDYTYPPELKDQIHEHIPDYNMLNRWQKGTMQEEERLFAENLSRSKRVLEHSIELASLVDSQYGWDVMLIQIQQVDTMSHRLWRYLTPAGWQRWPERAEMIFDLFRHLDDVLGKLAGLASGENNLLVIASDHGHGPLVAKVKPNNFLRQWGYLNRQSLPARLRRRLQRHIRKLKGKTATWSRGPKDIVEKWGLDWSRTRALATFVHEDTFIFLNVKGRQKNGVVRPGREYHELIEQLRKRFLAIRDPRTQAQVFVDAQTPEQLYGTSDIDYRRTGDLILIGADGYHPIRSLKGEDFFEYSEDGSLGGCHRHEGMYVLHGQGVKAGVRLNAHIADIMPTIYAALGIQLPENLDGKVLHEGFVNPLPSVGSEAGVKPSMTVHIPPAQSSQLTAEEEALISEKLSDLGYLE